MKEAAYKGMGRPILEYGSSVWDPHTGKLQEELEKVQNRAERFVTRNYVYVTWSMTDILGYLQMTLFPRLGVAGISTPWPFRYPQPVKMSIGIASSPRLSGTGMTSLNP